MTRTAAKHRSRVAGAAKFTSTQKKLHAALRSLFELLDLYSPIWYEKRFHDQAKAALEQAVENPPLKTLSTGR
jgi:hypothetical protein